MKKQEIVTFRNNISQVCNICKVLKNGNEFNFGCSNKSGGNYKLYKICKKCVKERRK